MLNPKQLSRPPEGIRFVRFKYTTLSLCVFFMIAYLLCGNTPVYAEITLPTESEISKRIERLQADKSMAEEKKNQFTDWLQQAITHITEADAFKNQAEYYEGLLSNAPQEIAEYDKKLAAYKSAGLAENLAKAPLINIEAFSTKEQILLTERRSRSAAIETEIGSEKALDLQLLLTDARSQQKKLTAKFDQVKGELSKAEEIFMVSKMAANQSRITMLEQKILSRDARLQLLEAEQALVERQIANSEVRLSALKSLITDHRQNEAERLLTASNKKLVMIDQDIEHFPQISELAKQNVVYAETLSHLVIDHDRVLRDLEEVSREATNVEQSHLILTEQLKISQLESSSEFGAALRIQSDNLADMEASRKPLKVYEQALTDAMLGQFQVDSERESSNQLLIENVLNKQLADLHSNATYLEVTDQRDRLLRKLSSGYLNYIGDLRKIIAQLQALNLQSEIYSQLLERQLIWMPSTDVFSAKTLANSFSSISKIFNNEHDPLSGRQLVDRFMRLLPAVILVFTTCMLLVVIRSRLNRHLAKMVEKVGKVKRDTISLTLLAFLLTFFVAVPFPLMLIAMSLVMSAEDITYQHISVALFYVSIAAMLLSFLLHSLRDGGLVDIHYKWAKSQRIVLWINLRWFVWVFCPLLFLTIWSELHVNAAVRDSAGRIAFFLTTLTAEIFIIKVFGFWNSKPIEDKNESDDRKISYMNYFFKIVAVSAPLFLIFISLLGYHYTAIKLAADMLYSVVIILFGIYLFYLIRRAFSISERRLALQRALAKRAALLAKSDQRDAIEGPSDNLVLAEDMQAIDIHTISSQTDSLLKMVTVIAVGSFLWSIWSDFLLAFQYLDNVTLWHIDELVEGSSVTRAITLWDLTLTIAVVVITFLAARNIPGLLEISILSSFALPAGTSYAITTISRYIIVITGSIIALQLLGAQWSKLQWLIAALSVGLGFGLQEIVANFVSGVVILFERPIRIGDTVTIGEEFGTVSVIRIRATTIVDWDRREVIIPNKTFITERLINWTLTDPIMRTIIKVGVAYGSDIGQVEKSLLEIAEDNPKVLNDPLPTVLFHDFGDSTLNFQLRVFIRGIHDLTPVIHEINVTIDKVFRQHNIEIAFPQRDIHFNSKPIEVRLLSDNQ